MLDCTVVFVWPSQTKLNSALATCSSCQLSKTNYAALLHCASSLCVWVVTVPSAVNTLSHSSCSVEYLSVFVFLRRSKRMKHMTTSLENCAHVVFFVLLRR